MQNDSLNVSRETTLRWWSEREKTAWQFDTPRTCLYDRDRRLRLRPRWLSKQSLSKTWTPTISYDRFIICYTRGLAVVGHANM